MACKSWAPCISETEYRMTTIGVTRETRADVRGQAHHRCHLGRDRLTVDSVSLPPRFGSVTPPHRVNGAKTKETVFPVSASAAAVSVCVIDALNTVCVIAHMSAERKVNGVNISQGRLSPRRSEGVAAGGGNAYARRGRAVLHARDSA